MIRQLYRKIVNVNPIGGINKDYIINGKNIPSSGTSFDSYLSDDDIEII